MVATLVIAVLLLGHGLIHLGFVGGKPSPSATVTEWPFELSRSWVLTPLGLPTNQARLLGSALVAATVAAFAIAALAALGLLPGGLWAATVVAGSAASLGLLGLFFQRWLVIGLAIDLVLLWAVIAAGWQPTVG
jgi:hypothetical protein